MKAVFIALNQMHSEDALAILDELGLRGFTRWTAIHGRGSVDGEPKMGTHTWPALNDALLCMVEDEQVGALMTRLRELNESAPDQGLRAFVWNAEVGM